MSGLFGGGNKTTTTTSKFEMSPEQRALIAPAIPIAQNYVANPPKLPDYSQIAPLDPNQVAAQQSLVGSYLPQMQTAGQANQANQFLLGDVLDPTSNQYLEKTIDIATRPIGENFLETILPGIRGEAITAGQFGGSRQGIAEGIAAREASRAVGDTSAKIASQGYSEGLNALTKGLALTPQTIASLAQPATSLAAVGEQNRSVSQAQLSEKAYRDLYAQIAPFLAAQEVAALGAGIPGGTASTTAPAPSTNPFSSILGLGSTALSLFGGPAGAAAGAALSPQALAAIFGGGGAGLY